MMTNFTEMKRIREFYKQLYSKKLNILDEMAKFLETHHPTRLNQEEESVNRAVTSEEIQSLTKPSQKKNPGQMASLVNATKNLMNN